MKTLDAEERKEALEAVRMLYRLGIIGIFVYEELIAKILKNTGA